MSGAPRIAVITFPGSNDDGDAMLALELLGAEPVRAWHADAALPDGTAGVVLPRTAATSAGTTTKDGNHE